MARDIVQSLLLFLGSRGAGGGGGGDQPHFCINYCKYPFKAMQHWQNPSLTIFFWKSEGFCQCCLKWIFTLIYADILIFANVC